MFNWKPLNYDILSIHVNTACPRDTVYLLKRRVRSSDKPLVVKVTNLAVDTKTINLAADFSKYPGGRYRTDGPFTGEHFRDDLLVPAIKKYGNVTVDLDGTLGLGSSFLEEAFGGLVRVHNYQPLLLRLYLGIVSQSPVTTDLVWQYIDEAAQAKSADAEEFEGDVHASH